MGSDARRARDGPRERAGPGRAGEEGTRAAEPGTSARLRARRPRLERAPAGTRLGSADRGWRVRPRARVTSGRSCGLPEPRGPLLPSKGMRGVAKGGPGDEASELRLANSQGPRSTSRPGSCPGSCPQRICPEFTEEIFVTFQRRLLCALFLSDIL
ncbi:uncharacterized protein LOC144576928 [Callithrix jacchus]